MPRVPDDDVDSILQRLGIDTDNPNAPDVRSLVEYVAELGASADEIVASAVLDSLGPLALDFALRPQGDAPSLDEYAVTSGLGPDLVRNLWLALGLPESPPMPFPVTPDMAEALYILAALVDAFGEEAVLGFARVVGSSAERIADALANANRVGLEAPQRTGGMPYRDVTRSYTELARELLPVLWDAVGAVFRRHLVLVSYEGFDVDRAQDAVTIQRAIGFIDLVGSTEVLRTHSVAEMAHSVNEFERLVGDRITKNGGRLVKLIGDEAMFSFIDARVAVATAMELVNASSSAVRVGLAFGDVVAMHGDYFGPTVNLAARLVAVARPSSVVVSTSMPALAAGHYEFVTIDTGPLRGFSDVTAAYEVRG